MADDAKPSDLVSSPKGEAAPDNSAGEAAAPETSELSASNSEGAKDVVMKDAQDGGMYQRVFGSMCNHFTRILTFYFRL